MTIRSMSISQRYELSKRILEEEQRCFHPDATNGCSPEGPIRSHSVSKGMSLAAIAENGHVISITKPFDDIVFQDKATVEPSGVKISSIFPGFCRNHDNRLFSLIETEGWQISKEACFILSYRSLSNTVLNSLTKIRYFDHMNRLDKVRLNLINTEGFSDDDIINDYDFSIFLQRYLSYSGKVGKDMEVDDIIRNQYVQHAKLRAAVGSINPYIKIGRFFSDEKHLNKMREMFSSKNYEEFRFIAFRYDCILPFVASKTIKVNIHSEDGDSESFVNVNICSNKNESFIVFGWIEDGGTVLDYLDSIILANEHKIVNRVLSYLFNNPTNTFFNKSWWDSLSEEVKHVVFSYHENEVNAFPEKEQSNEIYHTFIPEFLPASRRDG